MKSLFETVDPFVPNSVYYSGFDFPIDPDDSWLTLHCDLDGSHRWRIDLHSIKPDFPPQDEDSIHWPPQHAPSIDCSLPESVSFSRLIDFSGQSIQFEFSVDDALPIMPGIPSGLYDGEHSSCTKHEMTFGDTEKDRVQFRWKLLARKEIHDPGIWVYVDGEVEFAGARVKLPAESCDDAAILASLSKYCDATTLRRFWSDETEVSYYTQRFIDQHNKKLAEREEERRKWAGPPTRSWSEWFWSLFGK